MPPMAYRWRYLGLSGREVSGPEVAFTDQDQAEDWLGDNWQHLFAGGVEAVSLLHGESEVFGPMSLRPEEA